MLKSFNPLKKYELTEVHHVLSNLISQTDKNYVIYNDNVGYYFAPLRGQGVSLWLDNPRYYNLFLLLQNDIFLTKTVFKEMLKGFHWDLIEYFEERSMNEDNPIVSSFLLFCLHNLSEADDDSFGMYSKDRVDNIQSNIEEMDSFFIKNNKLMLNNECKTDFIISVEKDFAHNEGLLITKTRRKDHELIKRVGQNNIYYMPKRY